MPFSMQRSANSTRMIAPSTSMPVAMIRLNRTTMLMLMPKPASIRMPIRNEPGTAMPTIRPPRKPSDATMTIRTRTTAVMRLFSSSPSMSRISLELSWENVTFTCGGQDLLSSVTRART